MNLWNAIQTGATGAANLFNALSPAIQGIGGGLAVYEAYDRLGDIGDQANTGAQQIAQQGLQQTQFKPFTVTGSTGSNFNVGANGNVSMGLGNQEQQIQNMMLSQAQNTLGSQAPGAQQLQQYGQNLMGYGGSQLGQMPGNAAMGVGRNQLGQTPGSSLMSLGRSQLGQTPGSAVMNQGYSQLGQTPFGSPQMQGAASNAFGVGNNFMGMLSQPTAAREGDVYDRIRAVQRPEEERQRMALEERLFNQGRGGVQTNMYGGTPEQLAMSKAQTEAQNQAALMALQQAQQEQMQQANIGSTFAGLGSSLAGQQQALRANQQQQALQALQAGQGLNATQQQLAAQALQTGQGLNTAQQQAALQAMQTGQGLNANQQQMALQALQGGQNMLTGSMGLQSAQQQLGLGALAGAYAPQNQLLNLQQASQLYPQLQQRAQFQGAGLFGEASMGGLEALLGSGLGQANLMGQLGTGLLSGLF